MSWFQPNYGLEKNGAGLILASSYMVHVKLMHTRCCTSVGPALDYT